MRLLMLAVWLFAYVTLAQYFRSMTPVPILKQINRHNEDGSYSYGYEAADGSYKIESKYPNGEVYGKYGFVDDTGSLREVEYGASQRGFEPAGTDINVPPLTVHGNSIARGRDEPDDDGQYHEDPSLYYTDPRYTNGERYEPVSKNYVLQNHQLQQLPMTYNLIANKSLMNDYRRPLTQPGQPNYQEYQPQYRTQYQRQYYPISAQYSQLQSEYKSTPNRYTSVANPNFESYSVNYGR